MQESGGCDTLRGGRKLMFNYMQMKEKLFTHEFLKPMGQFIKYNNHREDLVGVEIGVKKALHAYNLLWQLPIKKLYLIDPYCLYDNYKNYPEDELKNDLIYAKNRLKRFDSNRYEFILKKSEDATNDVPDNLDFVYIDGNHSYEYVKKDIELWYPKVKSGGVFGGDDFGIIMPGVPKAVLEFVESKELKLYGHSLDWWVVKKWS